MGDSAEHGQHRRHAGSGCAYLGSRLFQQRKWVGADPLPRRLHVQTARLLYTGLLRSCGLAHENGTLTNIGERIAMNSDVRCRDQFPKDIVIVRDALPFGNQVPRSLPISKRASRYRRRRGNKKADQTRNRASWNARCSKTRRSLVIRTMLAEARNSFQRNRTRIPHCRKNGTARDATDSLFFVSLQTRGSDKCQGPERK